MDKKNNLKDKVAFLKELGFSEALLKAIEEDDHSKVVYCDNINQEVIEEPLIINPHDLNNIIIELSDKPMSSIYNAD